MTSVLDKAETVLRQTETSLQGIIQEATAARDYDAVMKLTDWARTIVALQRPHVGMEPAAESTATGVRDSKDKSGSGSIRGQSQDSALRRSYPRFHREDDLLAKVGWSKRAKSEYVHKAPHRVVQLVADALCKAGVAGTMFKATDCLPTSDPDNGEEIASYQAYLVLAWLRDAGIVRQHGRQGYTVVELDSPRDTIDRLWSALPRSSTYIHVSS